MCWAVAKRFFKSREFRKIWDQRRNSWLLPKHIPFYSLCKIPYQQIIIHVVGVHKYFSSRWLAQKKDKNKSVGIQEKYYILRLVLCGFNCVRQQSSRGRRPGGAGGKLFSRCWIWTNLDFRSAEPWLLTLPWAHGQDLAPGSGRMLKRDVGMFWKISECLKLLAIKSQKRKEN